MTVGQRIKNRRIELGMSAEKLGELLGKNRSTIYRYENGDIENMPIDILPPIAEALHTTPAYLMGWDQDQIDSVVDMQEELSAQEDIIEEELLNRLREMTTEQLARINDILKIELTEEEMADLLDYAKFLISKRKD